MHLALPAVTVTAQHTTVVHCDSAGATPSWLGQLRFCANSSLRKYNPCKQLSCGTIVLTNYDSLCRQEVANSCSRKYHNYVDTHRGDTACQVQLLAEYGVG